MGFAAHWQALAQIFAERMLNGVAEGIVLAMFGWALLRVSGRQNSSTRFALWFCMMVAITALPFFGSIGLSGGGLPSKSHAAFQMPGYYAVDIFMVWALIAVAGLAKIGFGFWQLSRLRQSCTVMDSAILDPLLRNMLAEFGSSRPVTICTSERVRIPAAIGFFKPAIIFPPWILRELSPVELNAVLLHELAHLRRWDDWTNLAQEIMRALFFFHPAFWWIGRGLALEREMACDDFVLARNSNPRAYAQCLVSVAEKSFLRRGLALAQAVAGRMQQTTQRVMRILDSERPTVTKVYKPALGLVAVFSAICLIALPHAPRLVAFDGNGAKLSESPLRRVATPALDSGAVGARMIPAAFHSQAAYPVRSDISPRAVPGRSLQVTSRSRYHHGAKNADSMGFAARRSNSPSRMSSPRMINTKTVNAKTIDAKMIDPKMIDANGSASNTVEDVSSPKALFLVIQTEAVDSDGRVWSISILRLTVFHSADLQIQKEIIPKST
ncbi:MAG: M56 family metallopeptidase [Candidatus Sulfotelmatobacter sp.]